MGVLEWSCVGGKFGWCLVAAVVFELEGKGGVWHVGVRKYEECTCGKWLRNTWQMVVGKRGHENG
jgi:hypothetical protein